MSNFIYYEKLQDYEEQVRKAKEYDKLQQELQRKDNIIKDIKTLLKENELNITQALNFYDGKSYNEAVINILDKIKELENE